MGEVAYLGTWGPEPGQDRMSPLGGDGTAGSLATGWPQFNRIAIQPAPYVGPGQVAWFQFTIQAPMTPGYYRLYLRPLIEGATWLEDFGVFWLVTVLNPDGSAPPQSGAVYSPTGYSNLSVPTPRGTFNVHLIKERLSEVTVRTLTANSTDCARDCPAKPLAQYIAENGAYAGMNGTYLCPPDYPACASKINSYDYAVYNSNLRRWINRPALIGQNALLTFNGSTTSAYRRSYVYGQNASLMNAPITAGITMFPMLLQNGAVVDSEFEQTRGAAREGDEGIDRRGRDVRLPRHHVERDRDRVRLRASGARRARRDQPRRRRHVGDVSRRLVPGRTRPAAAERDRPDQALAATRGPAPGHCASGSTNRPFCLTSQCTCGPPVCPVMPTSAIA